MTRIFLAVLAFSVFTLSDADAGKVLKVPDRGRADIKIVETTIRAEADAFVFVTTVPGLARKSPYVWMWTVHADDPVLKVFFAKSVSDSDFKVFFVDRLSESGPGRKTLPQP